MNHGRDTLPEGGTVRSFAVNGLLDPPVILTCLKNRYSGVSGTINALLPVQTRRRPIGYVGSPLPGVEQTIVESPDRFRILSLWEAIRLSGRPLANGQPRIWHVRRNREMLIGLLLRDVFRLPIRLVFTSAAIRQHSAIPRFMIRRMDAVIATTPLAAKFFPETVAVVGHGVDVGRFRPPASRLEEWAATGLPGRRGIGIFGRVREEKGIHLFVRALFPLLARHADVTAVIGGLCQRGDRPYANGLRREAAAVGLADRFVWTGEIAPADMPAWYRRVGITVACPLYEGYGLTPLEAMASGCAVVASRTGAFPTMVDDGVTGLLVATNDLPGLTQALSRLLNDPAEVEAMSRRGRERACARFSIEHEAVGIERVYEQVWQRP